MIFESRGIDCYQLSSVVTFVGGIVAIAVNSVYWVELSDIGWSYAGSTALAAVVLTIFLIAAVHVVSNTLVELLTMLIRNRL